MHRETVRPRSHSTPNKICNCKFVFVFAWPTDEHTLVETCSPIVIQQAYNTISCVGGINN